VKLLQKSSLYFVALLVPIFFASAIIFRSIIEYEIKEDTDNYLTDQMILAERQLDGVDSIAPEQSFTRGEMTITRLAGKRTQARLFSDTILHDRAKHRIHYRKMAGYFEKNGRYFSIVILHSKIRDEEVTEMIVHSLLIMFGLLLLGLLVLNSAMSRNLWRPFYDSLSQLGKLSFSQKNPPTFAASSTREFNELNMSLNKMANKMFRDYENQKQFTENASHELQTPLAVIKSKTDLLLQSHSASEEDMTLIADIERSVTKLTYLNRSLLLLSKLENRQFDEKVPINLAELFDRVLQSFEDRILLKHISIQKVYREEVVITMNPVTAEILFSNLIQNAIRYNLPEDGIIVVSLNKTYFNVSNTGIELLGDSRRIFDRFTKFNMNSESMGLGLSIVRQICDYYSFSIEYAFETGQHHFNVTFGDLPRIPPTE